MSTFEVINYLFGEITRKQFNRNSRDKNNYCENFLKIMCAV